jgi:hypothetical protein
LLFSLHTYYGLRPGLLRTPPRSGASCLAGGHTETRSGGGSGGADLSLRSLDIKGDLKAEFKVDKSRAEGLVNGIDNALSQVAADQADKVRACLQPVRERLLDVMLPSQRQGFEGQTVTAPGGLPLAAM